MHNKIFHRLKTLCFNFKAQRNVGFTIVEILVSVAVIGILATILVVSYNGWQKTTIQTQLKSDLASAATAMENARTYGNTYPSSVPSSFTPSQGVTVSGGSTDGKIYCLDALSSKDTSIHYYIDQSMRNSGAASGTCTLRSVAPSIPTNLAATATSSSVINLTWTAVAGATGYTIQRADNSLFNNSTTTSISANTSYSSTSLNANTTYYYKILATNSIGSSAYSSAVNASTSQGCNGSSQYGTYPNCYAYDSLPVGTSVSGYWSSAPTGYLLEDGSAVSRTTYADLFAVIGTTYGAGDGSTTFNLPDSRGRVAVNISSTDSEFNTMGEKYGEKTHTLTIAEMPNHNHGIYIGGTDDLNWSGYQFSTQYPAADGPGNYSVGQVTGTTGSDSAHNIIQPSITKLSAIKYTVPPTTSSDSVVVGSSIDGYWTSTIPDGYLAEDGSAVSRTTYADLFAAIGTTYGAGDGSTTFNLPDSRGRVAVNISSTDSEFNTMGEKYGEKTHVVTIAQMAKHTHLIYLCRPDDNSWNGYLLSGQYPTADDSTTANVGQTTLSVGGGQAYNVMQPSIVKKSLIKYKITTSSDSVNATAAGTSISGYWMAAPKGYLAEDGSLVSRTTYAALFAVIGTTYGAGDGSTTFNLPDSRGRVAVNKNASDTQFATIGQRYGEKTHTLTVAELPSHSHTIYTGTVDDFNWSGNTFPTYTQYPPTDNLGPINNGQTTMPAGGDAPHNVIQPSIVKMYAIQY